VRALTRDIDNLSSLDCLNSNSLELIGIGDITGGLDWSPIISGVKYVIHLAAHVHITSEKSSNRHSYFDVNRDATLRLARAAANAGVIRFVFLSTVKVHGEQTAERPFSEKSPFCPTDDYASSKAEAEIGLRELSQETGLEVISIRPPLVYGPQVKANFLTLLSLIKRSIPLPLAAVNNRRSMVYLENLVDAVVTCLTHPNAANKAFLVSDGHDISTPDLIQAIAKEMGTSPKLWRIPEYLLIGISSILGKGDTIRRLTSSLQVDSSRIRQILNWRPPYSFEEGIRKTVRWYSTINQ
jgi:nucleoside-diphosphate-sugar epimerase